MTDKCFDSGTIQAFLDGELASEIKETVARHVSACDDCAMMLADAEEESAMAFSVLDQEFNTLVPTQRLWTKINDSIEREKKSFWKPIFAFLLQPSTAAFAILIFVAVVSITLLSLKPDAPDNYVAQIEKKQPNIVAVAPTTSTNEPATSVAPQNSPVKRDGQLANYVQSKNEYRVVKTSVVKSGNNREAVKPPFVTAERVIPAPEENVPGEDSYLKTIASLTETVNDRKDQTLTASSRFAFERDLAVTNDAIVKMRREVRKNPNDEAAKQILRASYQNKIDLLSSVADKTELMASLK